MPTYRFYDKIKDTEYEELMTIAEMEKFIKKKHITLLPPTQMNIVSTTGQIDSKTDAGWKEQLSRIAEKHPDSNLGRRYRRRGIKEAKTKEVLEKHRKIARAKGKYK
tara:strand:- start:222 stop:542 length:321 start_codon:yes stop_codon:yes gene_type:complete